MNGKIVIFSAPSGSGKTTLIRHILEKGLPIEFSISATNRTQREGEINGKDYYFLTTEEFKQKIEAQAFIEWEEVYQNHYYGTLRSELTRIWLHNKHVIMDLDVVGGLNIKKQFPQNSLSIFVMPPSHEILRERLLLRNSESPENLEKRIQKAIYEMQFAEQFDKIFVNDHLPTAQSAVLQCVKSFLNE
ncbi:MAG: guanylate kinase [Bacteroidales bacterium]|jgi:guanylate kinase|nr:guanylate kinase [Bacteroidales bacterium]